MVTGCGGEGEDPTSPATSGGLAPMTALRAERSKDRNDGLTQSQRAFKRFRAGDIPARAVKVGICGGNLQFLRKQFVGDSLASIERAAGQRCVIRVIELAGQAQAVTDDYVSTRVNVVVDERGEVTRVVGLFCTV